MIIFMFLSNNFYFYPALISSLCFALDLDIILEGIRSGQGRGRGGRQPATAGGSRETMLETNPEPRIDPNAQVAAAI